MHFNHLYVQSGPKVLTEESLGVNYRALNDLFSLQAQRKGTINYDISVQMIEIYNEQVRDLLDDSGNRSRGGRNGGSGGAGAPPTATTAMEPPWSPSMKFWYKMQALGEAGG